MNLIMYSGDGKSYVMEAIAAAKEGDFALSDEKMKQANASLIKAHHAQTEMLSKEAGGNPMEVTLLMVHSQDHLMTSMNFKDLAEEIIYLHKQAKES